jgi:pilus assembly protein FimV
MPYQSLLTALTTRRNVPASLWCRVLAAVALIASQGAFALGLGDISVRSYLGQPLSARIDLLSNSPAELEGVGAALASAESFSLIGLNRMSLSVPLDFSVHRELPGAFIEISSRVPVNDPVLRFVVEVSFANGRLLREYTLFLDPPTFAAPVPLPAITPRPQPAVPDAPVAPPPVAEAPAQSPPVADLLPQVPPQAEPMAEPENESSEAAAQAAPADDPVETEQVEEVPVEAEQVEEAPVEAEQVEEVPVEAEQVEEVPVEAEQVEAAPVAEAESLAEAVAEVEETEETVEIGASPDDEMQDSETEAVAPQLPDQADEAMAPAGEEVVPGTEVAATVDEEEEELVRPEPEVSTPAYQASIEDLQTYGPVASGQTLWGIAAELSKDSGYDINQTMLAIQRYNPEAFGQDNINRLKRGAILRLPPLSEVARLGVRAAMLEALRQAEDYAEIVAGRSPQPRPAPILAESEADEPAPAAANDTLAAEGRLELVPAQLPADSAMAGPGVGADGSGLVGSSGEEGSLTEEELASAEQEAAYLSERLQELKDELGEDGAVLEVGDSGLAELEQRLRDERESDEPAAPVVVAPPTENPAWYDALGWWLALLAVLLVGGGAWWLGRRGARAGEDLAAALKNDSAARTARSIAGEAEEILRVLESNDPDTESAAPAIDTRASEAGASSPEPSRVIDLESYVGDQSEPPDDVAPGAEPESAAEKGSEPEPGTGAATTEGAAQPGDRPGAVVGDEAAAEPVEAPKKKAPAKRPVNDEEAIELDADDPETKLDLARAYISMGDGTAARELLEEVIAEGSEAQVKEARDMLAEI